MPSSRTLSRKSRRRSSLTVTPRRTCSTRRSATEDPLAQPDAHDQRVEARIGADRIEETLEHRFAREEGIMNAGRALEQCERAAFVAQAEVHTRRGRRGPGFLPDRRFEIAR